MKKFQTQKTAGTIDESGFHWLDLNGEVDTINDTLTDALRHHTAEVHSCLQAGACQVQTLKRGNSYLTIITTWDGVQITCITHPTWVPDESEITWEGLPF